MLKLQFRDRRREAVWLVDQTFTIGKNAQNSLMIDDASILDAHAEIINQGNTLILMDKSAGKSVWVNGNVVTSHASLKQNDVIKLGDVELVLIDPKNAGAPKPVSTKSRPAGSSWAISSKASWLDQNHFDIDGKVVIGRDPSCDITLALDHLSRRHATLEVKGGQLHIQDMDSSNGTYVNGERVTDTSLKPGDKIKLDMVTFEVIGPSHDLNKTIIRSAPEPQKKSAPAAAKAKPAAKAKSDPANKAPKPKKLAANGKQDWIAGDAKASATGSKTGLIVGVAIALIAIGIASAFLI